MFRAVTALFMLSCPGTRTLPAFFSSEQEHNVTFTISDCLAVSSPNLVVNSYSGTSPADCNNAKIFTEQRKRPALVVAIARYHPVQLVHCLIEVTIYTATCGATDITNARNHKLYKKVIYTGIYSPIPAECFSV